MRRITVVAPRSQAVVDGPLDVPSNPPNPLRPDADVAGAIAAMDLPIEFPDDVVELGLACDREREDIVPMEVSGGVEMEGPDVARHDL